MKYRDLSDQSKMVDVFGNTLQTFRGVDVIEIGERVLFVSSEAIIADRPYHAETTPEVNLIMQQATIDAILDGKTPVSIPIYNHLKQLGFNPTNLKLN